jgi:hypothetical protein
MSERAAYVTDDKEMDWIELGRLTSVQWATTLKDVLGQKNIPVVILSAAGHFGTTGQMGLSSFRPIEGYYSVMVPRERAEDADAEATGILGETWEKSRLWDFESDS